MQPKARRILCTVDRGKSSEKREPRREREESLSLRRTCACAMRCTRPALLLLLAHGCTAATTSSTGTTHSTAISSPGPSLSKGKSSTDAGSSPLLGPSSLSVAASSATTKSTTSSASAASPLVFLPQASESLCPSRTINYITHTLPQQCLRTSRNATVNETVLDTKSGTLMVL